MKLEQWRADAQVFEWQGYEICYWTAGEGPALLCVHGFPTAAWDWHALWPGLTRRFRTIALDMLGFGLSDKPAHFPYSIARQADLVEALMRHCGLQTCVVLAHDYGDSVATELLARQRDSTLSFRINAACLLNGGILQGGYHPRPIQKLLVSPAGRFLTPFMGRAQFARTFREIFGPVTQPSDDELRQWWALVTHNRGKRVMHAISRYQLERKAHAARWEGVLSSPPCPLRLVIGEADPISGKSIADAYDRLGGGKASRLPGIGHYPQIEAPDQVLAQALPFLQEHAQR